MIQPYIVAVTGGRTYSNKARVYAELDALHKVRLVTLLVVGCANGADCFARCWAHDRQVALKVHRANWSALGKAAGHLRNQEIVDHPPHVLIAFPGQRGTADCTRRARAAGIPVLVVVDAPAPHTPTADQDGVQIG
jgi:hypothetical protein